MSKKSRVLIADYANYDSLAEIPGILSRGGCIVDVYCGRRSWLKKNKYWNKWIESSEDEEVYYNTIKSIAETDDYDWIILSDDPSLRIVNDRVTDEALFYKLLPLTKIENRELLGSKAGFSNLCVKYGLKTPGYLVYNNSLNVADICDKLHFPMLLKTDRSEGGTGVYYCADKDALCENLAYIKDKTGLVIQEYIKGDIIGVEVLYKNGELLAYSYSKSLKTMYNEFSISTERLFYTNTAVEAELIKAGRSIGLNGFGNLAFIYNEEERAHYLIEIDTRPQIWFYYGKFSGVDFSAAVHNYVNNNLNLLKPKTDLANKDIVVRHFTRDVRRCVLEKDFKGLFKWISNSDGRWRYIPFYDGKLFFNCSLYLFQFLVQGIWSRVSKRFFKPKSRPNSPLSDRVAITV